QVRDGVAGPSAGEASGLLVVVAAVDGQEDLGARDLGGGGGLGSADLGQGRAFVVGQGTERILLAAGHGSLRGARGGRSYAGVRLKAIFNANDPLVLVCGAKWDWRSHQIS